MIDSRIALKNRKRPDPEIVLLTEEPALGNCALRFDASFITVITQGTDIDIEIVGTRRNLIASSMGCLALGRLLDSDLAASTELAADFLLNHAGAPACDDQKVLELANALGHQRKMRSILTRSGAWGLIGCLKSDHCL